MSVLGCAGFGVAAFLMRPVYQASVLMAPVTAEQGMGALSSALGQLGGLASLVGVSVGDGNSTTQEALAVLRSRKFTESFIAERNLMPRLFQNKWDAAKGSWKTSLTTPPTAERAFESFNRHVRFVTQDKKTNLVTLTIEWIDREEAADWANSLVQRLNSEMRARAIDEANASVGYLQKELDATAQVDTRAAINRLIEAQVKQRMIANVSMEYSFRVIDPAVVPDSDRPVRPRKAMMLAGGLLFGLLLGLIAVPLLDGWFSGSSRLSQTE